MKGNKPIPSFLLGIIVLYLGFGCTQPNVDNLISELKTSNYSHVREKAAKKLGKIKDIRAVEPLIHVLMNDEPGVREEAAWALGQIKDPRAVEPLIYILLNYKGRGSGVPIGVRPSVRLPHQDWTPRVRWRSAQALGKIKDPIAIEPLIEALKYDDFWLVQSNAADALSTWADNPCVVKALKEALNNKLHIAVADSIFKSLGEGMRILEDRRAVETLITYLKDESQPVRFKAAIALGNIKDTRAIEPLIEALKDKDSGVQENAVEALRKITGEKFGEDPTKWSDWWEKNKAR